MLIGIDGNEANVEKKVGASVYTLRLLQYFQKVATEEIKFKTFLKNDHRPELPKQKNYFRYKTIPAPFLWSQVTLPLYLYTRKKPDIFFAPAHYIPRFCPVPTVVTILDLAYEYYENEFLKRDIFKLKNWTRYAVSKAKKIIAISKNTKADIMKFYGVPEEKISVIYIGFSHKSPSIQHPISDHNNILDRYKVRDAKYVLYVGTLQPRKNISKLIEAFGFVLTKKPATKLVIVGKRGWMYEQIFEKVRKLRLENSVIFTDYISDEDVSILYQNASLFVLPSLYEGFGMPILEAMHHGCPVATSNISSLPEVGGNACLYFDPNDTIDIKNQILRLLDDEKLRNELIAKGKERTKFFSWEKCGEETLALLKSVSR